MTTLALSACEYKLTQDDLAVWKKFTNFSALRVLKLEDSIGTDVLGWAAISCSFSSLETLVLRLNNHESQEYTSLERPQVSDFLYSLDPLKVLEISGGVSPGNFRACIQRHAPALLILWISEARMRCGNRFDSNIIEVMREYSPLLLEDLVLPMKRSKEDENEVAVYNALGALP